MANPPPPYDSITGISRAVMKDNAQETIVNYDGNARPGEIVVDLTTNPPTPYIGNNLGELTLLTSAGSYGNTQVSQFLTAGLVGNIIPTGNGTQSLGNSTNYWANLWVAGNTLYIGGVPVGVSGNTLTVNNTTVGGGLPLANGNSKFDIATVDGNVTITADGSTSTFATGGTLYPANDVRVGATGGRFIQDCADGTTSMRWYGIEVESESELIRAYTGDPAGATPETERARISVDWTSNTQSGITIVAFTDDGNVSQEYAWKFQGDSTAEFAGNVRMGASAASQINTVANSSGDGNGYTTIQLVPDETVFGNDQYLIIDPTGGSPGHIHIRAGGIQDDSAADLFLGGENSYVKLPAGSNPNVEIAANSLVWTFGSAGINGELTLPAGEGAIKVVDDSLSLVSFNTTSGNANSVYLGSGGGLGFFDGEIGGNWLQIFRSGAEPEITVPVGSGNANLYINNSSSNNVKIWNFGAAGDLTAPGNINADTGYITGNNIDASTRVSGAFLLLNVSPLNNLPPANSAPGLRGFANDANLAAAGNFGAAITDGGANTVPVWSDGSVWRIG